MNILAWIIVGGLGGWLASFFVKLPFGGLIGTIVTGVVGALIAGWLGNRFFGTGDLLNNFDLTAIITAFIGAILFSVVLGFVMNRR